MTSDPLRCQATSRVPTTETDPDGIGRPIQVAEANEQMATVKSLVPILKPHGIAVVGVSETAGGIGRRIFDAIRRSHYKGALFAVNGKGGMRGGLPTHASMHTLPLPVDLAVIAVPHAAVPRVVDDCAAAGVKGIVVISAGFAETDAAGLARQQALVAQVRRYGMRMIGPNCMGILNTDRRSPVNASFSPLFGIEGHLALASQSGALGVLVIALSEERHVGISSFVSLGNKADVSSNDLLQYWEQDPATTVVGLYLESFGNPRTFARLARRVGRTKPILAVKAGRTRAGSRAAGSHTAALAASDTAVDALFRQTGVIRAATIDELIDTAASLAAQPLPAGRRVAIITNAGGPGILAADACEAAGLTLATLSETTTERLRAILPAAASLTNPIDMIASAGPSETAKVITAVLTDLTVDGVLVLQTGVDATTSQSATIRGIHDGVLNARRMRRDAPVLACIMGAELPPPIEVGDERVPVYAFPENAVRALGHMADYAEWLRTPTGDVCSFQDCHTQAAERLVASAAMRGDEWLSPDATRELMEQIGAPLVSATAAHSLGDALERAGAVGYPLVAKLSAKGLLHKTEAGGVITGIADASALRAAFGQLQQAAREHGLQFDGVVLQPMVQHGIEACVGVTRDAAMGALVGVGMGGTDVEVIGDMQFGLVPLTDGDADRLVARTRLSRLLSGYRGRPAADGRSLAELLLRLSQLADAVPAVLELDLNPVMVLPDGQGCVIVDARVRIAPTGAALCSSSADSSARGAVSD